MGFGIGTALGMANAIFGETKALIRYLPKKVNIDGDIINLEGLTYSNVKDVEELGYDLKALLGVAKSINPDVRKGETVRLQSDITEYAVEDGSIVSEHIIQRPIEVTLTFEETNAGKMIDKVVGIVSSAITGTKDQSMYDKLLEIWEDKIQVEITTDQDIYKNMVIKSMPIVQSAPYKGAYKVMCTFQQITTPTMVKRRAKTSALEKSASTLVDGGKQLLGSVTGG